MNYRCTRCDISDTHARIAGCGRPTEGPIVTACPMEPIGPATEWCGAPPIVWAAASILITIVLNLIF